MSRPLSACQSARVGQAAARPLSALPKAHLHLHLTGAMRHATLIELAGRHGIRLPTALTDEWPPQLSGVDERGWFRFQRLYDIARSVLRSEDDVRRLLLETAQDEAGDGSGWLEIQVDPSGYAAQFGGLTPAVELVLSAAREATAATGVGIGVIIASNRTKHPLEARTLARLAARSGKPARTRPEPRAARRCSARTRSPRAPRTARPAGRACAPRAGAWSGWPR